VTSYGLLYSLLPGLQARYPGWDFSIVRCRSGPRIQALRPGSASGLYADQ
jgi:hypothetical protein